MLTPQLANLESRNQYSNSYSTVLQNRPGKGSTPSRSKTERIANRGYAIHCHRRGNNLDCFSYLARSLENCLEVHFPGIGTEVTNAIKNLLRMMNRQLIVDQESAAELAELKLQQVSVVISIISKTESYKGNSEILIGSDHTYPQD